MAKGSGEKWSPLVHILTRSLCGGSIRPSFRYFCDLFSLLLTSCVDSYRVQRRRNDRRLTAGRRVVCVMRADNESKACEDQKYSKEGTCVAWVATLEHGRLLVCDAAISDAARFSCPIRSDTATDRRCCYTVDGS